MALTPLQIETSINALKVTVARLVSMLPTPAEVEALMLTVRQEGNVAQLAMIQAWLDRMKTTPPPVIPVP